MNGIEYLQSIGVTDQQVLNLLTLAEYLYSLPEEYSCFDMSDFTSIDGVNRHKHTPFKRALHKVGVINCGTAGCAVGHGPIAGVGLPLSRYVSIHGGMSWKLYCEEQFLHPIKHDYAWSWCFSSGWAAREPTPRQAADRIRLLLEAPDMSDAVLRELLRKLPDVFVFGSMGEE